MKILAQKHPVWTFILLNFAWTWLFWLGAIPLRGRNDLLVMAIVMIGGFGPAIAGTLTLGLRSREKFNLFSNRPLVVLAAAGLIFALLVLRYLVGNVPQYDTLAENLSLSVPVVAAAVIASLAGGWALASALSGNADVRARMGTILPRRLRFGWLIFGLLFYPALILLAWGLSALLGMGVEYPGLWGKPALEVLPLYALTFVLVLVAQGGNEEPGWRGFLQPELEKRFSPLVAALIVSLFWSLWHLPLYLNGFYPGELLGGMLGGGIFRILLAIFLAWFYRRSGGSLFLMMYLHACFNVMVNFLPTSDVGLMILWLLVVIVIVVKDKMYRR